MSQQERKSIVGPNRLSLSLNRQCELLSINRSSFYYTPNPESPENLALMRRRRRAAGRNLAGSLSLWTLW